MPDPTRVPALKLMCWLTPNQHCRLESGRPMSTSSVAQADHTNMTSASKVQDDHMKEAKAYGCTYLNIATMCHEALMAHKACSFQVSVAFGHIEEEEEDSLGGNGNATRQCHKDHCSHRPSDHFTPRDVKTPKTFSSPWPA